MAVRLSPIGNDAPFVDASGNPLSGGKLYFYTAGSSTPQDTYTTSLGNVANANPVILDSNGYPTNSGSVVEIWFTAGVSYKAALQTSASVPVWTRDNLSGINDTSVSIDQWVAGPTPTYVSATSFTLAGDQTSTFHVGRRVKTTNSGGTAYSTIKTAVFAAVTTITLANDSTGLDSGLSAASYGLLSATNPSTPLLTDAYPIASGSADKTKKFRVEVDGFTTDTTRVLTPPNADLTLPNAATLGQVPIVTVAGTLGMAAALTKGIFGLTYSNNVGDPTNDIDFAAGGCMDSTGASWMTCAAMTKRLDAGWSAGTGNGMRNSAAAIADVGYYLYAVGTLAAGSQDYYAHTSATVATALAALQAETGGSAYVYAKRIGYILRATGALVLFHTYETEGGGLDVFWDAPTLDIGLANTLTTSRRTDAVKAPLLFSTLVTLSVVINDAAATQNRICCPDETDAAPSATVAPLSNVNNVAGEARAVQMQVRTSATGTIAARSNTATVDLYNVSTMGFRLVRRDS